MISTLSSPEHARTCHARRTTGLRRLIAVHFFLAAAPAAIALIPADVRWLPAFWALGSVTIGQLLLLSFWVGLGSGRGGRRFLLALLTCGYAAAWIAAGQTLAGRGRESVWARWAGESAAVFLRLAVVLLIFGGAFFAVRRRYGGLRLLSEREAGETSARIQYSILHLLVITSAAAVGRDRRHKLAARGKRSADDGLVSGQCRVRGVGIAGTGDDPLAGLSGVRGVDFSRGSVGIRRALRAYHMVVAGMLCCGERYPHCDRRRVLAGSPFARLPFGAEARNDGTCLTLQTDCLKSG